MRHSDENLNSWKFYVRSKPGGRFQLLAKHKDEAGEWRQVTKMLPPEVNTELKAKRRIGPWREELAREAEARAAEEREEAARAEADARGSGMPVADYVDRFVETQFAGSKAVKPSTLNNYRTDARRIRQYLGGRVTMAQLTPERCQRLVNDMNKRLGPSSVRKTTATLKRVCEHAVRGGAIPSNPCDGLARPRMRRAEKNSMTSAQYARLCSRLSEMEPTPIVVAAEVALGTGMREGEICALRWQDVDLGRGVLHVAHNLEAAEHGFRLGDTKRPASTREIPIGDRLVRVLSARRAKVWAQGLALGMRPRQFATLYVLGGVDGRWMRPTRVGTEWAQLSDALGLVGLAGRHVTFHDLRHTYATVAIAAGADVMAVSSYLGHADPHVTLREYANADPDAKRRTAELMDRMAGE